MVPSDRVPALLKWTHESSHHVGADRTLRLCKQWFHTTWTDDQLRKTLRPIVDKCPCRSRKPGDVRDRGFYSTLPMPTVLTVFSMWTTLRCRILGATTLPSWGPVG